MKCSHDNEYRCPGCRCCYQCHHKSFYRDGEGWFWRCKKPQKVKLALPNRE